MPRSVSPPTMRTVRRAALAEASARASSLSSAGAVRSVALTPEPQLFPGSAFLPERSFPD